MGRSIENVRNTSRHGKVRDLLVGALLLACMLLVFYVTGIGCPIRFATGVSCPGCGMTRAWISALTLRFDLAIAYHPLFWLVPPLFFLVAMRQRIPRNLFNALIALSLALIIVVWLVRLAVAPDSNMIFSSVECVDVVSIGEPPWLQALRSLFASIK